MSIDLDQVKQTIKQLTTKRDALDNERRELQFKLDKLEQEKSQLEPQILEMFGTLEREPLLAKMAELEQQAQQVLQECESLGI